MPCPFCQLVAGNGPVTWVARETPAVAFLPLASSALAPGHTLVAPAEHVLGLHEVDEQTVASTMDLVRRVALAAQSGLGATGVNVLSASGAGSEQSVPHLHFHVVPRWEDDGFSTWPSARSSKRLDMDPGQALRGAMAALPA